MYVKFVVYHECRHVGLLVIYFVYYIMGVGMSVCWVFGFVCFKYSSRCNSKLFFQSYEPATAGYEYRLRVCTEFEHQHQHDYQ